MKLLRGVLSISGVAALLLTACSPATTLPPTLTKTEINSAVFNPQVPEIRTSTATATRTLTATVTLTPTDTPTPTASHTSTSTATPTTTPTATATVTPTVTPTPTTTPLANAWRGTYYKGSQLVLTRDDSAINFNWGTSAPAESVPSDGFWVHWERPIEFAYGTYRFYTHSDDGVRVWLNDEVIIDEWHDSSSATYLTERTLEAGIYTVRVDYYENAGSAQVQFWWERPDEVVDWRGEYYSNPNLSGSPMLVRNDWQVDYVWGTNSPDVSLPNDGFSVRWSRTLDFDPGLYEFHTAVDDGVRVWVDNQLVIDDWNDGGLRDHSANVVVARGSHTISIEYYERQGEAEVHVNWQRIGDIPTSTPTNTPTSSN